MSAPILHLQNAFAGYGINDVLKDISVHVAPGEIVTLLGANGAGKSTIMNVLSGLLPLRKGKLDFLGKTNFAQLRPDQRLLEGLVLCPEGRRIFPRLTVEENLLAGALRMDTSLTKAGLERTWEWFPVLAERRNQLGGTLSGGEQQMLAISRALMSQPKLLLLDEPSLGLAPLIVEKIFEILVRINASGLPLLLVEQNAHQALKIAHRAYILSAGCLVKEGSGQELLASDEVRRAYLGED